MIFWERLYFSHFWKAVMLSIIILDSFLKITSNMSPHPLCPVKCLLRNLWLILHRFSCMMCNISSLIFTVLCIFWTLKSFNIIYLSLPQIYVGCFVFSIFLWKYLLEIWAISVIILFKWVFPMCSFFSSFWNTYYGNQTPSLLYSFLPSPLFLSLVFPSVPSFLFAFFIPLVPP